MERDSPIGRTSIAVLVLLAFGSAPLVGQTPPSVGTPAFESTTAERTAFEGRADGRGEGPSFRFQRLGSAEGLSQGSVYSLLQDSHGFVWLGTQDGLHRFDGYRFDIYKPDPFDPESLSHGMVRSLHEDSEGNLWVGTFRGLNRLDSRAHGFERPLDALIEEPLSSPVTEVVADANGSLWIATEGRGLIFLSADRLEAEVLGESPAARGGGASLPSSHVRSLHTDPDGTLWVGFEGAGLARIDIGSRTAVPISLGALGTDVSVHDIVADPGGGLWLALGDRGLAAFDPASGTSKLYRHDPSDPGSPSPGAVETLLVDSHERLWVGTLGGGLSLLEPGSRRFVHFRHQPADSASLSHDSVRTLIEDDSGLIWVGTALGGVTLINTRSRFGLARSDPERPGTLPANAVRAFLEQEDGTLWVATDGGGVVSLDEATGRFSKPETRLPDGTTARNWDEPRIWSLFEGRDGKMWIGGQEALYRLETGSGDLEIFRHDPSDPRSLGEGSIRSLIQDEAGRVWIAHFGGGLSRLDRGEERFDHFRRDADQPFTLVSDLVLMLYNDRRGQMWIGTAEGLARRTADGRFHSYRHDPSNRSSLLGAIVRAIHQDVQGNLWVGTDAGLDRLPANRVQSPPTGTHNNYGFNHYTELDGLPNNTVYGILEDNDGRLWLATNNGLAHFDPKTETFTSFDLADGLQGLEFNGGASLRASDGYFYFGGVNGYNVFDPSRIEVNRYVPPVVVTRMMLAEAEADSPREIPELPVWKAEEVVLDYDEPFVSFEFAALDFTHSRANRYAYRIDGLDDTWHELGTRNELTLTHLDPGEYTLRLRGSNDDGVWNEDGARLGLRVRAAPWQSGWAKILYAFAALLALGLVLGHTRRRRLLERRIEDMTRTSERRLDLALLGSGDGLWDWNLDTGEIYRHRIAEMLGYSPDELPADREFRDVMIHPDDQILVEKEMQAHLRGETDRLEVEVRMRDRMGRWRWILDRGTIVERHEDGRPKRMAGTFKDMTAHKQVEAELRLWSTVFESVDEGVLIVDTRDRIQAVNDAFCALSGYRPEELHGHPARMLESPEHSDAFYRRIRHAIVTEGTWSGEIRQRTKEGRSVLTWVNFKAVRDDQGTISHYLTVVRDITERKAAEDELRYLATCDVLTGLPNRSHFQNRLEAALEAAREEEGKVALLFGDLDQFKQINDTLGHALGDMLLRSVSKRLMASVREQDLVARLGGDEFTVLLDDVTDRDMVVRVADRILGSFARSFQLDGQEILVSTSLGISLFPDDGEDGDTLLKHADTAMYEAKARGRNRYRFYAREMTERALARMSLDNRLRRALQENELVLHYQPKLNLATGKVGGLEALLRWPQSDGVCLPPSGFLEVAEETGLIVPIGEWVLRTACSAAAEWKGKLADLDVSVNVAASQLDQDDFVERLESLLSETGLAAERLILELTENAIMDDAESRIQRLQAVRQLGVRLSIDDFGTGYSSLGHLQRLPIDELKIDRSFVRELVEEKDASIPRTILAMASGLELEVVAEGVETVEQLRLLKKEGCQRAQGYLISSPLPLEALLVHLKARRPPWADLLEPKRRRAPRRKAAARGGNEIEAGSASQGSEAADTEKPKTKRHLRIVE